MLGDTLEEIAFQKGGIYKEDVPAMTVAQPEGPLEVLRKRASNSKVRNVFRERMGLEVEGPWINQASAFTVLPPHPDLTNLKLGTIAKACDYRARRSPSTMH